MSLGGYCEDDDPPLALAFSIEAINRKWNGPAQGSPRTVFDLTCPDETPSKRSASKKSSSNAPAEDRIVFVASAGNSASCRANWPAAFDNVVGVGALGPDGPANFTNYGSWVDACAPGVDLVSTFFDLTGQATDGVDRFKGWAMWSGTSFSAPLVAAQVVTATFSPTTHQSSRRAPASCGPPRTPTRPPH